MKLLNLFLIVATLLSIVCANVIRKENFLLGKRFSTTQTYYYDQLDEKEKIIYDTIKNQIEKVLGNESLNNSEDYSLYEFKISDINLDRYEEKNQCHRANSALIMDNPNYFWLGGNKQVNMYLGNITTDITIKFDRNYEESSLLSMYREIQQAVQPVVEKVNQLATTCEKLKYIHDYLIKQIVYSDEEDQNNYNVYGALVKHSSVCEGYAEAFQYICQLTNINSILVNSQTHEWNFVQMEDGRWYAMDITYDDPKISKLEFKSGNDKNKKYDFFLIGTNSQFMHNDKKIIYRDSIEHRLIDYIVVTQATGFQFPELSEEAYSCPLKFSTNYIKDYYIPNKNIYFWLFIALAVILVILIILICVKCIKNSKGDRIRGNSEASLCAF